MTTTADKEPRLVKLQANTTGAWRNIMTFDVEDCDDVLNTAENLFEWDHVAHRVSLRVIIDGDTMPLMYWTALEGWKDNPAIARKELTKAPTKAKRFAL